MTSSFLAICFSLSCLCAAQAQVISQTPLPEYSDSVTVAQKTEAEKSATETKAKWYRAVPNLAKTYRTELKYAGIPLLVSGGWVTTYTQVDAELQEETQEHRHHLKDAIADRLEPFGRGATILPGFSGFLAYGLMAKDARAKKAGIVGLSAFFINANVTHQLKQFFNRHRPNSGSNYNNWDGPEHATGQNHSFPSSHTSTAFSAATVIASVYKDKPAVPVIAYSMAGLVGASRIYQNHHWASDVLAGAVVGYLTAKGTLAAYDFIDRKLQRRKQMRQLMVMPQVGNQSMGLNATLVF